MTYRFHRAPQAKLRVNPACATTSTVTLIAKPLASDVCVVAVIAPAVGPLMPVASIRLTAVAARILASALVSAADEIEGASSNG